MSSSQYPGRSCDERVSNGFCTRRFGHKGAHRCSVADIQAGQEFRAPRESISEPFEVISKDGRSSHGTFATLEEAQGCVAFDKLTAYEIWRVLEEKVEEEDGPADDEEEG